MITQAVHGLAPDPAVPQRDTLLDSAQVARRLSACLGADGRLEIQRCRRARVNYGIGKRLRVLYRIQASGRSYHVYSATFRDGRSEQAYRDALAAAVPSGRLRPVVHDAALDAVFCTFPNDRKIAGLPAVLGPTAALGELAQGRWTSSRLVAYVPERSAIVQCLAETGEVVSYAKAYAGEDGARTRSVYEALVSELDPGDPHLRLAREITYSEEHKALLLEPVEGVPLVRLGGARLETGLQHFGAAIARLHTVAPPAAAPPLRRLELDEVLEACDRVGRIRPDVAGQAHELAAELRRRWEPPDDDPVCLHGDVTYRNAIMQNGAVALIDLDQVSVGPAVADVARMLGLMRYQRRIGRYTESAERRHAAAFLEGYATVRDLPDERCLAWHIAAELLVGRALRTVKLMRTPGLARLEAVLADAQETLDRAR